MIASLGRVVTRSAAALLNGKPYLIGDIFANEALRTYIGRLPFEVRWDLLRRDARDFETNFDGRTEERMAERYRGINEMLYTTSKNYVNRYDECCNG